MSWHLICSCDGRFILHNRSSHTCSKCGSNAYFDIGTKASSMRQLDVDYACPITGKPIRSKRAHEDNLLKHGKQVQEPGVEADAARNRARLNQEFEDRLCDTAVQQVMSLPPEVRDALEKELLIQEIQTTRG